MLKLKSLKNNVLFSQLMIRKREKLFNSSRNQLTALGGLISLKRDTNLSISIAIKQAPMYLIFVAVTAALMVVVDCSKRQPIE
jgi:hypothetical protein